VDHALTRRGLSAGFAVAAGAAALGASTASAGAVPARALTEQLGLDPAADPIIPGLTYRVVDGSAFTPRDFDSARPRTVENLGTQLAFGGALVASLDLPLGAVRKR
jgi:hypothetical protein